MIPQFTEPATTTQAHFDSVIDSLASRARYERETLAFEQKVEAALCLWQGSMTKLRQASGPTPDGRRARRQWLADAYQYLMLINPPTAEYPEDDACAFGNAPSFTDPVSFGDQSAGRAAEQGHSQTFTDDLCALLRSPSAIAGILLALILAWCLCAAAGAFLPR